MNSKKKMNEFTRGYVIGGGLTCSLIVLPLSIFLQSLGPLCLGIGFMFGLCVCVLLSNDLESRND